jgi:hypothetical protein
MQKLLVLILIIVVVDALHIQGYKNNVAVRDSLILNASPGDSVAVRCTSSENISISTAPQPTKFSVQIVATRSDSNERAAHFSIPRDNYEAYLMNELNIVCTTTESLIYMQLNIDFVPFIDTRVARVHRTMQPIECPIRAPNFPPYKYQIAWISKQVNAPRHYHNPQNFTLTSHLFDIPSTHMNGTVYTCNLIESGTVKLAANVTMIRLEQHVLNYTVWLLVAIVLGLLVSIGIRYRQFRLARRRCRQCVNPRCMSSLGLDYPERLGPGGTATEALVPAALPAALGEPAAPPAALPATRGVRGRVLQRVNQFEEFSSLRIKDEF